MIFVISFITFAFSNSNNFCYKKSTQNYYINGVANSRNSRNKSLDLIQAKTKSIVISLENPKNNSINYRRKFNNYIII